jgi:hypothetical protein
MKGDARRRHATTGDATTSRQMRGKREERRQRKKGDGASIGQGCAAHRHHGTWRQPPWPSRLRLQPRSLRTMPMAATAVSPSSAARLSLTTTTAMRARKRARRRARMRASRRATAAEQGRGCYYSLICVLIRNKLITINPTHA